MRNMILTQGPLGFPELTKLAKAEALTEAQAARSTQGARSPT
jgi:hypothetical protein